MADCSVFIIQFSDTLLGTLKKQVYDFFIIYHLTASFPASPIYYGFSGEYYIKSKTFSKKLYHTSREIARGSFRCFTGGSPAFLTVWGGQTEREAAFLNIKLHAARFRVCVGLLADRRITAAVCKQTLFQGGVVGADMD